MTQKEEKAWERGNRAAWLRIIQQAVGELGIKEPAAAQAAWIRERERTVEVLREICEEFGCNDWPDNLFLPDVLEKHLQRYLELPDRKRKRR